MSVEFLDNGMTAIYRTTAGQAILYRCYSGIYFHEETPREIVRILCGAKKKGIKVRLRFGDTATGRDWLEEYGVEGYIKNSCGPLKVPILIPDRHADCGPAISDNNIVRILAIRTGQVLYQHRDYHVGKMAIRVIAPDERCGEEYLRERGFTHAVEVDGSVQACFKTAEKAKAYVSKMLV